MNEDSLLKKFEKIVNPIRGNIKAIKSDTNAVKGDFNAVKSDLKLVKKLQSQQGQELATIRKELVIIKETQETHTSSLLNIETTMTAYGDMYKINDDNIRKIEKRTETLEKNAGIETPDELTLLKVQ